MRIALVLVIALLAGVAASSLMWALWSAVQNLLAPRTAPADADGGGEGRERDL